MSARTGSGPPAARPAPSCQADGEAHLVERASPGRSDAVAEALADAFADYPFTNWIVPEDDRSVRLHGLFSLTVSLAGIPHGDTWIARCPEGPHPVIGAVVGLPPDSVPTEVWTSMAEQEAGLLGPRLSAAGQADEATAHLRPTEPHYTIATMGVARDHWRRGLAMRLLQPALGAADELKVPCYLETSSSANVMLYERAGFAVIDLVTLPGDGPPVWGMYRPPHHPRVGEA